MKVSDIHNYQDIIDRPYCKSNRHHPMSINERAAQFAPFAALTNHKGMIEETERLVEPKRILDEDRKENINEVLSEWKNDSLTVYIIEYFEEDLTKDGGKYIKIESEIHKIDPDFSLIYLDHDIIISIDDIYDITIL